MIKVISFPGGCGGNWLKSTIEKEPVLTERVHFHDHRRKPLVNITHTTNPTEFDYLFSGDYYFNFFINVIYKCFHIDQRFTSTRDYKDYYTECVNTAKYVCSYDSIAHLISFNFADLINNDSKFFQQIDLAFPEANLSYPEFRSSKDLFFKTMVSTREHYENFDSQIWVTFVLGQLMIQDIVPSDFSIYEPGSQLLASKFAKNNYEYCTLKKVHHFDSAVSFPPII